MLALFSGQICHKTFYTCVKARVAVTKGRLTGVAELENRQVFRTPPTLAALQRLLLATCEELQTYKLWPVSP